MSCSKNSTIDYMVERMLIKPNMELYTPTPSKRLTEKIDKLTNLAKSKYGVDMGPLFFIKSRTISTGNQLLVGSAAITSKVRVEPNDVAFEAIDRSVRQQMNEREIELRQKKMEQEVTALEQEGNYIVSEGEVVIPTDLPRINIKC